MNEKPITKSVKARASVGDTVGIARQTVLPAMVAARFALIVALLACVVSGVALAVALSR